MKVKELIKVIEKDYNPKSALSFDNTGSNIINFDDTIKGIVVCLDVTLGAIKKAKETGANMMISHHPLTFREFKNVRDDIQSKRIKGILNNNINAYSVHTNFDVNIDKGMGKIVVDRLFKKNEIKNHELLETYIVDKKEYGYCDIVILKKNMSFSDLSERVFSKFDISIEKSGLFLDSENKIVKKIAILPGSGRGDVHKITETDVDVFITSDLAHNDILDLLESGISYINTTHYGLEKIFIEYMKKYLKTKVKCGVNEYYDYKI